MIQASTSYNLEWFKKRAFTSLKRIDAHTWDFSDSLLLYISEGVKAYESIQETDTPYYKLVTKPEREYLASVASAIASELPDNFEYIDLGPGTEHKEQFFFDELKKQNKKYTYMPVDISKHYLNLAQKHAEDQNIPTRTLQVSFEELQEYLGPATTPRFVSLGLTFSNYDPQIILPILQRIAGANGFIFITAHIRDRVDMKALQHIYELDVSSIGKEKLQLIGLDTTKDVTPMVTDDGIRAWCTVIQSNKALEQIGVTKDDKLLVFQSLRYTKEALETALKRCTPSFSMFDTGAPFIATLIRT